jgi:hypothetical protein
MSAIPLHLQRRFEQKWAARFGPPPAAINAPKNVGSKATPATPTGRRGARQRPKKPGRREAGGLLATSTNTFNLAIESDVCRVAVLLGRTGRFGRSRRRHNSFRCAMMRSSKDRVGREERDHHDCQRRSRARFHVTRRFSALSLPLFGTTS